MKFAYLLMYELRAVHSTVQNLYDNVINRYDADVFICAQKTFQDDEDRLKLFNKNVVYSELYDKPDPREYFGSNNNLDIIAGFWNNPSNLQIYINYHKMANAILNVVDKYDYFILLRSDSQILFPFPDKELFETAPEAMYFIDAKYSNIWGDEGIPTFIHRNYIIKLLNSYYDIIYNKHYSEPTINVINKYNVINSHGGLNQERFQNTCLYLLDLTNKKKFIKALNYYFTACPRDNNHISWSVPHNYEKYNVICKYDTQCDEAHENYNLWLNENKWVFRNDSMYIG